MESKDFQFPDESWNYVNNPVPLAGFMESDPPYGPATTSNNEKFSKT